MAIRGQRPKNYDAQIVPNQWRPGQSGNPTGRRLGIRSFVSIARELLVTPIVFKNPLTNETSVMPAQEAIVLKCIDDARHGNYFALKILIELVETSERYHDAMRDGSDDISAKKDEYERKLREFKKNVVEKYDNNPT